MAERLMTRQDGANRIILAAAAPAEVAAVWRGLGVDPPTSAGAWTLTPGPGRFDVLETGIGKANAAGAVARALRADHAGVLSVGVAGLLPGRDLALGEVVVASACVFADEGVESSAGFTDCEGLGFPLGAFAGSAVPVDEAWGRTLSRLGGAFGPIACVSTCAGTDARARVVAERTGAVAEAMEGAAVALVAHRAGVRCGELRVISNTTGERERQRWALKAALGRLEQLVAAVSQARLV